MRSAVQHARDRRIPIGEMSLICAMSMVLNQELGMQMRASAMDVDDLSMKASLFGEPNQPNQGF